VNATNSIWARASLQAKIFVNSVGLVVVLVGGVLLFSYQRASGLAEESLARALEATQSLYENLEAERFAKLELVNLALAENPYFKAVVAELDAATALDSAQDMIQQVGSDFMIVTDYTGVVLARTDLPGRTGEDLSDTPMIRSALEGEGASGLWQEQGRLYHAASIPLIVGPEILGSVTSGYGIGDYLAQDIKKWADCEVVFVTGSGSELELAGSTLGGTSGSFRDWLAARPPQAEASRALLELGRETFHAALVPLTTVEGEQVGSFAALRSRDRELAAFSSFQRSVLLVGALMLVLAVVASLLLARGITRPIKLLVRLTDRMREGEYEQPVEIRGQDEIGVLAGSFRALAEELREKALMEKYISQSAAEMIQRTGPVATEAERQLVTVLFSDLRAFTSLDHHSAPEEVLTGVNAALSRQGEIIKLHGGQVDKFIGDKMLAIFKGPDMVWAAVRCASALQQELERQTEGPTGALRPGIGVSTGEAVFGSVGTAERLDHTFLGTAVHLAGRLCDEALPGDILITEAILQEIGDRFPTERLPPMNVHGLEAPVDVFLLAAGTMSQASAATARLGSGTLRSGLTGEETAAMPAAKPTELRPGRVLGDRYEIRRVLGSGGMGMVFQAHDRELDEPVALKVLRPELVSSDPAVMDRFKQEIRVARRISHRNIVRTHDLLEIEGVKLISMEYVEGPTLKQLLRSGGPLPLEVGLRIAKQTCAGLTAAHQEGVVHRDVKPQNIVVTRTSEVKIMDFGIARATDVKGLTGTGLILGTPDYLSPEQAQGSQDLDHRSDIYSMGVVLHEIFSGQLPFQAETAMAVVLQHVQQPPPRLREVRPDLPEALEAIVLRCLEKDPALRYPTMQALHDHLLNVSVRAA